MNYSCSISPIVYSSVCRRGSWRVTTSSISKSQFFYIWSSMTLSDISLIFSPHDGQPLFLLLSFMTTWQVVLSTVLCNYVLWNLSMKSAFRTSRHALVYICTLQVVLWGRRRARSSVVLSSQQRLHQSIGWVCTWTCDHARHFRRESAAYNGRGAHTSHCGAASQGTCVNYVMYIYPLESHGGMESVTK